DGENHRGVSGRAAQWLNSDLTVRRDVRSMGGASSERGTLTVQHWIVRAPSRSKGTPHQSKTEPPAGRHATGQSRPTFRTARPFALAPKVPIEPSGMNPPAEVGGR